MSVPSAESGTPPRAGRREWTGLAVLILPMLLVSMDVSVLLFAVPFISRDLQPSATQSLWILDVYGFVLAGLLLTMGALGDRIGRRRLLLIGATAFGLASTAAAYAGDAGTLIAVRALLGVGGATLMPSTLALVRNMFHDARQRSTAISIWTGAMTLGVALGPVLSGVLLEHFWWGSVFLINLPAMALLLCLAPVLLPEFRSPAAARGRFDLAGSLLSLGAVLPVVYGIKRAADVRADLPAFAAIAAGLLVGAAFVWRQRTARHPMIDGSLLRSGGFRAGLGVNTVATFAMLGFVMFTTQYLQSVRGYSPLEAALWALLPSVVVGGAAPLAAVLARATSRSTVVTGGFLLAAAGYALITQITATGPLWTALVSITVPSLGIIGISTQVMDLSLTTVPPERAGTASALMETGQEFGGALGMAVLGSVGNAVYRSRVGGDLPAGLPGPVRHAVRETLPDATVAVAQLPGRLGGRVLHAARDAFAGGMHAAALAALLVMVAGAAVSATALRRAERRAAADRPAEPGPADGGGAPAAEPAADAPARF